LPPEPLVEAAGRREPLQEAREERKAQSHRSHVQGGLKTASCTGSMALGFAGLRSVCSGGTRRLPHRPPGSGGKRGVSRARSEPQASGVNEPG